MTAATTRQRLHESIEHARVILAHTGHHELAQRLTADWEAFGAEPGEEHRQAWRIAVEVPLDALDRDALFSAVAQAVHDWEPEQRDGWDANVHAEPVTVPAWALAPAYDPSADGFDGYSSHDGCDTCHRPEAGA